MLYARLMSWLSSHLYNAARWCEGEAVRAPLRRRRMVFDPGIEPVFDRDLPSYDSAFFIRFDSSNPDLRDSVCRGYMSSRLPGAVTEDEVRRRCEGIANFYTEHPLGE